MRLIAHAGATLVGFTSEYRFTRTRMTHQGQGRYNRIADTILEALEKEYGGRRELDAAAFELFGHTDIQAEYQAWRKARRRETSLPLTFVRAEPGERPIERLVRQVGGVSTLSRLLCVNEFTLRRYWWGDTQTLPEDIIEALLDTGWRWADSFVRSCDKSDRARTPHNALGKVLA
jgi:hypothetical protein